MLISENINNHYKKTKKQIQQRLLDFKQIPESEYFYELCFCLCTPQSKAANALIVVDKLKHDDFQNRNVNPINILNDKSHYIRFHNQKANNLVQMKTIYPDILSILKSEMKPLEKRLWLAENVKGLGMKESSHFLRNIGYYNLAILDRHILKHLVECGVYKEIPKVASINQYLSVERDFLQFSKTIKIPVDELDLLFWSFETGEILK
ncbi:MAG: N-glycosylase/DNA lyase [Ignavibacteriae bacterium]|nr:N-glycosylase/DNA lyase [Ignavibacteriota bacterium]